ncbi:MAG: nucleotidyltransferase family protein [Gammaproteobacteria bacterium]
MMEAIVLAGGFGTRLGELTRETPKPMLRIGDRPFLYYVLRYLAAQQISRVVLSVGHLSEQIHTYFGDHACGMPLEYCPEEMPLGTAGALRLAMEHCNGAEFLAVNGDTLVLVDLAAMLHQHHERQALVTLAACPVKDASRYGAVIYDSKARVTGFAEKGQMGSGDINAGMYLFQKQALTGIPPGRPASLEQEVLPKLAADGRLYAYASAAYFIDIGVVEDYRRAQREIPLRFTSPPESTELTHDR